MSLRVGCECHAQLIDALSKVKDEDGIIVHIPTQDGRGYGMATKLETEAIKQGAPSAMYPDGAPAMNTVAAAMNVFGEANFDLRTFGGVGRLLQRLGFKTVDMITDNRIKVAGVAAGADNKIVVNRVPTHTLETNCCPRLAQHVAAKHRAGNLYYE